MQRKKLNLESKYITYQSVATNFSLNNYISEYLYEIEVIGQKNDNSICWAATAASASNFLRNTTYDADDVAKLYYGQNNYNRGIDPSAMPSVLLMLGITSYTHMGFIDNYSENALSRIVYNNIVNYKPAFFSVTYSHANVQPYPNYHSVLIYGVDLTNNMIVVMDPWQNGGFYAAYYGESVQLDRVGYKYISPILGTEVVALRMTAFYTTY